mmetsp:Transcript_35393/g.78569  ORF Transcript_35393/g.78569 Transcript_35393/m.78569 type:complete len:266 (+) Transcript_35393:169-966(+)|eukprot:CAMPEP_0202904014 /NCGR_PEP_ID=MMETSP1392-20130828/27483_1 /ASSEMBLY_ACC=CAM_ASM_000868 /TAXON_ID=225041 /ORGANISM="Chlamydomonas chlamydogama, Strain SAG 11-48b" /LENGTH=265 /DNA_ID=CAMNT_0049591445 /DNA_START=150 /DNA_END=947 /DNA_ORIENTATION=-
MASKHKKAKKITVASAPVSWQLALLGECIVTCLWVSISSCFAEVAQVLCELTEIKDEFSMNIAVLIMGLLFLTPVCKFFWGALINPVHNVALIVSGQGDVKVNILRMVGQLAGALLGTYAAMLLTPVVYQGRFHQLSGGLRDGVALELGFACEAVLTMILNLIFLYSMGAKRKAVTTWVPLVITIINICVGAQFTGPSLNPYVSFSWNFVYQKHSFSEHVAVFWLAPIVGACMAGVAWRLFSQRSSTGVKLKAAKIKSAMTKKAQ